MLYAFYAVLSVYRSGYTDTQWLSQPYLTDLSGRINDDAKERRKLIHIKKMYEDKDNPCSVTGETEIIYSKFVKCRQV